MFTAHSTLKKITFDQLIKSNTNLSIAGHNCIVKQEIGTKEKYHSIKHS